MSSRLKRILKRAAIGFALLVAVLLIINGALAWQAQHRLDANIAAIRAAGEPASLTDLSPKPIPAAGNAAVYLREMVPQLDEFMKRYGAFYQSSSGKEWMSRESEGGATPNAEQASAMKAILDAFPTILSSLQQAAACDEYVSLLDFNLPARQFLEAWIERSGDFRSLARFVHWKMMLLMAEGKTDAAARLGLQALRLTRLYDHEMLMMNYLMSIAVRGVMIGSLNESLRESTIDPATRALVDQELAAHDSGEPLVRALRSERAFAISNVQQQAGEIPAFLRWPALNWLLGELEAEDAVYEFAKNGVGLTKPQADNKPCKLWPADLQKQFEKTLVGPALRAMLTTHVRNLIQLRCLRVLNALEAYRQRSGHDAQRIDQLGLPREATIDPYTGETLLMKKSQQGWIVYSVWENGVDDGGRKNMFDGDWGVFPPGTPEVWADGSPVQSN